MTDTAEPTTGTTSSASASYAELVADLRATFNQGRTRPLAWRRGQLEGLVALLTEHEDDIIRAVREDLGRPAVEGYIADVGSVVAEVRHLLKHVDSWARPRRAPLPVTVQPARGRIVPEPLGVALVIAPWNYPVQLLLSPMAAALAAGNCVVAKPSELAPASSAVLARLIPRYLDDRAVAVVEGAVPETTALLEQRFDHVFFTGSTAVGRVVMEAAARHLTPVTLELGGKSPTIVAADADLEVAARRIVWGKFVNAGQTCIAPDYVLADAAVRDQLVERLDATIGQFYGSDPRRTADFGRIVNHRHLGRLRHLLETSGGAVVTGGQVDEGDRYLAPTLLVDPDLDAPVMQEEIFGPILPVLAVGGIDEAVAFVNDRPKPLALYVFSSSSDTVDDIVGRTSSGGACVNHCVMHFLPHELPFGGVGPSGMGAYHGKAGFDTFSHLKSVLYKPQRPDPKILYPPYTRFKEALAHRAL